MLNLVLVVFLLVGLTSCEFSGLVSDPQISKRGERKRGRNHRKYIKRSQSRLDEEANSILDGSDRYNLWWTGPTFEEGSNWRRAEWSAEHQPDTNAIFTVAVTRGPEGSICSSPLCHLRLFLGSARRSGFTGDIVIAVDGRRMTPEAKQIMLTHRAVVYQLPSDICSVGAPTLGDTGFSAGYFCGSEQERIPVSVFRYYVYEKWTALYDENSLIFLSDFQDVIFQSDPFTYRRQEWQEYALVVFQSFHPNMLINRAPEYSSLLQACYGANVLNLRGSMIAVTPGAFMGTRNGILSFSRAMTTQLQDAPGRVSETRCSSQGIDKAMANYLVYNARQRNLCRTKVHIYWSIYMFASPSFD
jgi:hypothetical protein